MGENTEREKRPRGQSIALKLTAGQLRRIAAAFLSIDIFICIIFLVMLFKAAEDKLNDIWLSRDSVPYFTPYEESRGPGYNIYWTADEGSFAVHDRLQFLTRNMAPGSRDIELYNSYTRNPVFERMEQLNYRAYIPYDGYNMLVVLDLGVYLYYFRIFMYAVLVLELLILIGNIGKSRRRINRALYPLFELTQTAYNINAGPFVQSAPGTEKIHVEGAIDALNAINVNRLDTRISIGDERQELRGLAGAINAMLDRLDAAYKSQLRFVSDASHELRTPISVVQGYANLLDRWGKNDPKALQESIDAIKSEAESMKELVEQLLFLARGDNDSITLNPEVIDCTALLGEVLRETAMIDPNHKIKGSIDAGLCIYGDAQLVKQAVRIFVDNSIKYTPHDENISINGALEGGYVKITVADSGIGIADEDLPNVFDRFFRSDESRTRATGGTGLGLSIAKWIVDRHGGYINILSRAGLGTKSELHFPNTRE